MEQTPDSLTETSESSVKATEERGSPSRKKQTKDKQLSASPTFMKLKRDLKTMVTNIQAAAEAREVQWRTEIDKARKTRLQLLEDHSISSKHKMEEISNGWHTAKEKVTPQEVQAMYIHQQQLCAELIADKKKIIDAIQQDLKARDDSFVVDLKKQTEELQLMLERMIEQDNTLTKAYREELEQWKETVQKEEETECTEDQTVWEKCMKTLLDTEVEKLWKRQRAVEEFDTEIYHMIFKEYDSHDIIRNQKFCDFQNLELEMHQIETERIFIEHKIKKQKADDAKLKADESQLKAKMSSFKSELTKLWANGQTGKRRKEQQPMEQHLKELNRKSQDYERLQKKILHYVLANTIMFENMWLTLDAELKELMGRALYVDSTIYKEVLGMPWEPPTLSLADPGGTWEERCAVSQTSQCSQDPAIATHTDADNRDADIEGLYSEGEAEVGSTAEDSIVVPPRTVKKLMELICDEAGFLLEVKIVKLLDTLDEKERTQVKMGYLFNTLGIEEKDVPKLVNYLYKFGQPCSKDSEEVEKTGPSDSTDEAEPSSSTTDTSDLIDQNDILHTLKCFLDQQGSNTNIADQWSLQSVEVHDMSKEEAYWESKGNVIVPDKLKIWDVTNENLERHHAVLSEISELNLEVQSLQQENTELHMVCMLLQQVCMDQPLSLSPDVTQIDME